MSFMASKSRRALEAKSSRRSESFEGNLEEKFLPLLAIALGVSMGIGLAYMTKKYFLKELGKTPSVTYVEERKPRMSLQDPNIRRSVTLTTTLETASTPAAPVRPLVFTEETPKLDVEPKTVRAPLALFRTPSRESSRSIAVNGITNSSRLAAKRPYVEEPSIDSPGMRIATQAPAMRESRSTASELRNVNLKSMSFSKSSFQRCQEDCYLNFRNARGEVVRTKLKKSVFAKLLNNYQGSVDIDGIESKTNGQRLVTIRSLKPLSPDENSEDIAKASRKAKSEKPVETTVEPEANEEIAAAPEPNHFRAKLEANPASKRKQEETPTEEVEEEDTSSAQSFQARLKRSVE